MTINQLWPIVFALCAGVGVTLLWARMKLRVAELEHAASLREARAEGEQVAISRVAADSAELTQTRLAATQILEEARAKLLAASSLSPEEASAEIKREAEKQGREVQDEILRQAKLTADGKARALVLGAIERAHVSLVNEVTAAAILLPSDDMKGRIIGRDGRNIRAFEQAAGVDLIIDETPETVVISSFDPIRREVARIALMNLMLDGRIHPARIEEAVEQARPELDRVAFESGLAAAEEINVGNLPDEVILTLGQLRFRSSLGQNVLNHSVEVVHIGAQIGAELGLNLSVLRTACLLHDIGKALSSPYDGPHALAGMRFLEDQGLHSAVTLAVGAHHEEIPQSSDEAKLVAIADSISAARRGARRENLETYLQRMHDLEHLAAKHPAVDRTYAIQAGREIRVFVRPEALDDAAAQTLARDLAKQIESELNYPGQVKVTIIRESRFSEVAQ